MSQSLEAIILTVGFFVVMGVFAGMYLGFLYDENNIGVRSKLQLSLQRIVNAVNDAYVLGKGNSFLLDLDIRNYGLVYENKELEMSAGGITLSSPVFCDVRVLSFGNRLVIENVGDFVQIRAE